MTLLIKVILAGDGSVGKSSLRKRFMGHYINTEYIQTIGTDLSIKNITVSIGSTPTKLQYQIWDLAGQKHFSNVRSIYYKGVSGIILVYDITNRTSFENIVNWLEEVRDKASKSPLPLILLANKVDLRTETSSTITTSEGLLLAKQAYNFYYGNENNNIIPYFETSAKTGENVELAFLKLADMIVQKNTIKKNDFTWQSSIR